MYNNHAMVTEYKDDTLDYAYAESVRLLERQKRQIDGLNNKSGILLGVVGVIFSVAVGQSEKLIAFMHNDPLVTFLVVSILGLLLAISIFAYRALRTQAWESAPIPETLRPKLQMRKSELKRDVLDSLVKAYKKNNDKAEEIASNLDWAFSMVMGMLFLLTVLFFYILMWG